MLRRRVQGALQGKAVVGLPATKYTTYVAKNSAAKGGMNSHVVHGCSIVEWSIPGACCLVSFGVADVRCNYLRFISLLRYYPKPRFD